MTDRQKQAPHLAPEGARRADARDQRLARALRANLAKRKAQQRARDGAAPEDGTRAAAEAGPGNHPAPGAAGRPGSRPRGGTG